MFTFENELILLNDTSICIFTSSSVFGSELDDSLDTSNTLINNWPASMASNGGHYVDGNEDDDLFEHQEGADELVIDWYSILTNLIIKYPPLSHPVFSSIYCCMGAF